MRSRAISIILTLVLVLSMLAACGQTAETPKNDTALPQSEAAQDADKQPAGSDDGEKEQKAGDQSSQIADSSEMTTVEEVVDEDMVPVYGESIRDGEYPIAVDSSSSMFSIVSALLHVQDGRMTVDMTMGGKGYLYVYMGTPEEAVAADASEHIAYTEDADGAHVFTVPVDALDAAQKCAAFSKSKEKWYDRTLVFRADSLPIDAFADGYITTAETLGLEDGEYTVEVTLAGGSGRASVASPAKLTVSGGSAVAELIWSSSSYDYMVVNGEKYLPISTEGGAVFEIPVSGFDIKLPVAADTTAMSTPHEIEYTLFFDSSTITAQP